MTPLRAPAAPQRRGVPRVASAPCAVRRGGMGATEPADATEATMNGYERDGTATEASRAGTERCQAADEPIADGEAWRRRAGFTRAEYRRLVFLRWLHRRVRLTE